MSYAGTPPPRIPVQTPPTDTQGTAANLARNTILSDMSHELVKTLQGLALGQYTPVTTVALLPAGVPAGSRSMVSNATATTFASVVAGGGANVVPVYFDGSVWRIG